jgi:hypothetical protein
MLEFPRDKQLQVIRHVYMQSMDGGGDAIAGDTPMLPSSGGGTAYIAQYLQHIKAATSHIASMGHAKSMAAELLSRVSRTFALATGTPGHGSTSATTPQLLKELLQDLKVQCTCQPLSWLNQFLDAGGVDVMFALLDVMVRKSLGVGGPGNPCSASPRKGDGHKASIGPKWHEAEVEVLRILKTIINQRRGLTLLLGNAGYAETLVMALHATKLSSRTAVCDFLLVLATVEYPTGHTLIIQAFEQYRVARHETRLFQGFLQTIDQVVSSKGVFGSVVGSKATDALYRLLSGDASKSGGGRRGPQDSLLQHQAQVQRELNEFLVSAITLLRYVVEVPKELDYRIHLRNQLRACGIAHSFKRIKTWAAEEFRNILGHIEAFEASAEQDHDEFVRPRKRKAWARGKRAPLVRLSRIWSSWCCSTC